MKIIAEMPSVKKCSVSHCAYNQMQGCHAKAITVGDIARQGCDTFFGSQKHTQEDQRIAGVGACKVSGCSYNQDFECSAPGIEVGILQGEVLCLTFSKR